MSTLVQRPLQPRKTPVQARSTVTVAAISEAAVQVLLMHGLERLTTTRVAERAGVSVGTLYQYYPNKQALLLAVLEQHLARVTSALERVCVLQRYQSIEVMVPALVEVFVTAKLERADISVALYSIAAVLGGPCLVIGMAQRSRKALEAMLVTVPGRTFHDVTFTAMMLAATLAGTTRAVLEAGATPKMVSQLRKELTILTRSYLLGASEEVSA